MLASTEKRLGLIAASALTAASLLMLSQPNPMTTYQLTATNIAISVEKHSADRAMPEPAKWVANLTDEQTTAQHIAMR